jgi:hypothetical protein
VAAQFNGATRGGRPDDLKEKKPLAAVLPHHRRRSEPGSKLAPRSETYHPSVHL